jgi:pyruvate formate lyase activating enzyme
MISRRDFLSLTAWSATATAGLSFAPSTSWAGVLPFAQDDLLRLAPKARYWTTSALAGSNCAACHLSSPAATAAHAHDPTTIRCLLCAQHCDIRAGQRGRCRARMNVKGELRSLVYGRPAAIHIDPIEKKPFYHFLPGASALSFGTSGCPLHCRFCQNWELSQSTPGDLEAPFTTATDVVGAAVSGRRSSRSPTTSPRSSSSTSSMSPGRHRRKACGRSWSAAASRTRPRSPTSAARSRR